MIKIDSFKIWRIKNEIRLFELYLEELKVFLDKKDIGNEETWKKLSDEEQELYLDSFIDYKDDIIKQNQILYSSFIITIFSFFEAELNKICERCGVGNKDKIMLKDFAGSGILRANIYMRKVCRITVPEKELWEELEKIKEVRDCLVHSGGEVKLDSSLIGYAKKNKKIIIKTDKISQKKNIETTKDYCVFVNNIVGKYLLTLIKDNPSV